MFKTMTSAIDSKKNPSPEEIKKIPSYVFCKWLSGDPRTIGAANQINQYFDIPIENQYKMIKTAFAGKIRFIPYPKSNGSKDDKTIEYLSEHFKISVEKAREYLELIDQKELQNIVTMYREAELKRR